MAKVIPKLSDPGDIHAERRDKKLRKKHHLTDNRASIRLISKLGITPKHDKKI